VDCLLALSCSLFPLEGRGEGDGGGRGEALYFDGRSPHPGPLPEGAREQYRPARGGPLRSNAFRPLSRLRERVGVMGLPRITPISVKAAPRPPPSPASARPLLTTRLAMKRAGLTHDKFMFAQRPRPLTPALSPKGRGSNTGQLSPKGRGSNTGQLSLKGRGSDTGQLAPKGLGSNTGQLSLKGAREQYRPARGGPLRSSALRLPLPRRGERVGVRGLSKITPISIKATPRPPHRPHLLEFLELRHPTPHPRQSLP